MRRKWISQLVILVLLLNGIHLLFFATSPIAPGDGAESFSLGALGTPSRPAKPWPELPSFRPWTANSSLDEDDCERIFGNGFTVVYDLIHPQGLGTAAAGDLSIQEVPNLERNAVGRRLAQSGSASEVIPALPSAPLSHLAKQPQQQDNEQVARDHTKIQGGKAAPGVIRSAHRVLGESEDHVRGTWSWRSLGMEERDGGLGALLGRKLGFGGVSRQRYRPFSSSQNPASFRCAFSDTLSTSVCEGTRVVMDCRKLKMSRGGEKVTDVLGRPEEDELPSFSPGAFAVATDDVAPGTIVISRSLLDKVMPQGQVRTHSMRDLLDSMRTIDSDGIRCSMRIKEPTLFVTRFEYANLFHTVTDWYSAYVASRVTGLKQRPNLIFVDGHCQSPLDDGWKAMFSSVSYAMHYNGQVCFDRAIFVPLGYESPIFKGLIAGFPCQGCALQELQLKPDQTTTRLREFGEFFVAALTSPDNGIKTVHDLTHNKTEMKVLFIRREDYLAHPRHTGKPESRLSNEEEVYEALNGWAAARSGLLRLAPLPLYASKIDNVQAQQRMIQNLTIVNGLFAHVTLEEQVRLVQDSSIIVGAHGAGLTHAIFAKPGTIIVELLSAQFARPHFNYIAQWSGLPYVVIQLEVTAANCSEVLDILDMLFYHPVAL